MRQLKLMSSNCGTLRTATLADDGEVLFSDGSKSTKHVDKGFPATTVFVAMWMHKDVFTRYKPAATQAAMFNLAIDTLGADKPNSITAHIFNNLSGKKSVVMLDGTEHYFINVNGAVTSRTAGNVYADRYSYLDVSKYAFIDYVQYTTKRRIVHFVDGSWWQIVTSDKDFYWLCARYLSPNYNVKLSEWMATNYFSSVVASPHDKKLNIFNYDASPIFCDDAPEPYTFRRGVLYGVLALAFMLLLSSCYLLNQCIGAY